MRNLLSILFCLGIFIQTEGQDTLVGNVYDNSGIPLTGANVYFKGSYSGTITDGTGSFSLPATPKDSILVISFIGYQRTEIAVNSDELSLTIELKELASEFDEVRISAGSFEASEENRAVLLDPIEIATTASSEGDIYGALSTFPGAQKQGETGKLIVRGGEEHETKTHIDGMAVTSPYGSSLPDLPTRGRFTPFMFNGVMFSTGGYSAEYGQALSSVIELQTPGIFDSDITSVSFLNVGLGASLTRKQAHSAYSAEAFYSNTYPFFAMASHSLKWTKVPQNIDGKIYYRKKIGKTGMIKTDVIMNSSISELDYSDMNSDYDRIGLRNNNQFIKSTYNTELSEKWLLKTGCAININTDKTSLDSDELKEDLNSAHAKLALNYFASNSITIRTGADANLLNYHLNYHEDSSNQEYRAMVHDWIYAAHLEGDFKLNRKIALRVGARVESSTYNDQEKLAPRTSLAYKVSKYSQLSFAWGMFFQQASHDYLKYFGSLDFEQANHLLLNYQIQKSGRILRFELYNKQYKDLITYLPGQYAEYQNLGNNGNGYARGADIFWKDNGSFKHASYWFSYSYIDSKRKYHDFPVEAVPGFVSEHNLNLVYKYWIDALSTQISATYTFSSGRSYFNPNQEHFMIDRTPAIHDLSANASYITELFGKFTVVHLSVSNILGSEHIYSYNFSDHPNHAGIYEAVPVHNMVRRTIILGLFISFD